MEHIILLQSEHKHLHITEKFYMREGGQIRRKQYIIELREKKCNNYSVVIIKEAALVNRDDNMNEISSTSTVLVYNS